jgi:hypothetical protein
MTQEPTFDGYPLPAHHPTRWAKYYLMKCIDCGLVVPARISVMGKTYFRCINGCGSLSYDMEFGDQGFEEIPAELAENWDYPEYIFDDDVKSSLSRVRSRAIRLGDIPGKEGEQLSLL